MWKTKALDVCLYAVVIEKWAVLPVFSSPESRRLTRWAILITLRPSSIRPSVNNFFKHLLLLYYLAKSNQTSQECSLHGPLQNSFKEINSMQNSGCHGNQKEKLKKSSSPKWLNGFHCNLVWMFLGWTSCRFLEKKLIRQKTWPPWVGLIFTI